MIRKIFVFFILALVISTTLIKNHTKNLDEKIFTAKENINYLNSLKEMVKLEHDYLTSPEKLLNLYSLYFDDELSYTHRKNIIIINDISQINTKYLNKNE